MGHKKQSIMQHKFQLVEIKAILLTIFATSATDVILDQQKLNDQANKEATDLQLGLC